MEIARSGRHFDPTKAKITISDLTKSIIANYSLSEFCYSCCSLRLKKTFRNFASRLLLLAARLGKRSPDERSDIRGQLRSYPRISLRSCGLRLARVAISCSRRQASCK